MIYFDEAGNSGSNLLDRDQPSYVLLSHNYDHEETEILLRPLLERSNASELHFKNLKKYNKFKNAIIACINDDLITNERVYFYYAHKKFMVCIQIVDQLIEPVMHNSGINIYSTGYNIATANLMYMLSTTVWDKLMFEDMCTSFVKWNRSGDIEDCAVFYKSVSRLYSVTSCDYREIFEMILASQKYLLSIRSAFNKYSLDATLGCFNAHCNFWAKIYGRPFDIIFDNSKQIEYWKEMILFLTESLPSAEVGYGSRKHKYPLLINSLRQESSESLKQIQLADIFASSINYLAIQTINDTSDDFSNEILKSKLFLHTSGNSMWPSREMTPEELGMTDLEGINPLDFLAEAAIRNPTKFNKAYGKK